MRAKRKMFWYVVVLVAVLVVIAVIFRDKIGWGGAAITAPVSYGDAVRQYGDQRIQFDMSCQARPANGSYKNGSSIMLDNRSGDARIITIHGVQYHLAGYGWKIITLSSKTLPATWVVDCGAARNVSNIYIQK